MEVFATDPRGLKIYCDETVWSSHIVIGHTVMENNKHVVKTAIERPDAIYESDEYSTREAYFAKDSTATYGKNFYTKVIVDIDSEKQTGEVVTAFPCKHISGNIKEGGLKYVKSKL